MRIIILFLTLSFLSFKRKIFKLNKEYYYEAVFIKSNGDTLTNETIILDPKGRPWLFQFSQTAYWIRYSTDTTSLFNFINPINERQKYLDEFKKRKEANGEVYVGLWEYKDYSGAVEDKEEVWIHPFRSNQYIYTQIAPFPEIEKNQLKDSGVWTSKLYISTGYDNFAGEVSSTYRIVGKTTYKNQKVSLTDCWKVNAVGKHSTLGESTINYIFHPENGFVQMHYTFYNGVKIHFNMIEIIDKRRQKK